MGKKNKTFRQHSAEGSKPQKPTKPARVVQTRGSLTFDSYLCCGHTWVPVKKILAESPDLYTHGSVALGASSLKPGQNPEFEMVCVKPGCGAGATFGDIAGRKKVVAYDRDWNYGIPHKEEPDVKEAKRAQVNEPVTWEDGLAS